MNDIVDLHQHIVPDFYVEALKEVSITKVNGLKFPAWSVERSLKMMDSAGIEKAFLSYSTPGVDLTADPAAFAKRCNNFLSTIRDDHPERFGAFGSLPISDPNAATEELIRVLDDLKLNGICVLSNSDGVYLDDGRYEELLEALEKRHATVFIHPTDPKADGYEGLVSVFYGWFMDTSRAVVRMNNARIFDQFPNITFILAHGGGALPAIKDVVLNEKNRRIYCDSAKVAEPSPQDTIQLLFGPDRTLFGSDFPWAEAKKVDYWIRVIKDHWADEPRTLQKLLSENAQLLMSGKKTEVTV